MKSYTIALFSLIATFTSSALATGSMRIEVEVYNGPLSKSLEIQKAELMGTVNVTHEMLKIMVREFHLSQCALGCFGETWSIDKKDTSITKKYCNLNFPVEDRIDELLKLKKMLNSKLEVETQIKTAIEHLETSLEHVDEVKLSVTKLLVLKVKPNAEPLILYLAELSTNLAALQEQVSVLRENAKKDSATRTEVTLVLSELETPLDRFEKNIKFQQKSGEYINSQQKVDLQRNKSLQIDNGNLEIIITNLSEAKKSIIAMQTQLNKLGSLNKRFIKQVEPLIADVPEQSIANSKLDSIIDERIAQLRLEETIPYYKDISVGMLFPSELIRQYKDIFPVKDFHGWLRHEHKQGDTKSDNDWFPKKQKIPVNYQDKLIRVCPVLSDVKSNMLETLRYMYQPLVNIRTSANYTDEQLNPVDAGNTLLHCHDKLLNTKSNDNKVFKDEAGARECLTKIAKVGKILSEGAEQWATAQIALLPKSTRERIVVARAAISAAESGNEIVARADAISKQHDGISTVDLLPTSVFLRDSEATDYLNLVDWLQAYPRVEKKWSPADRTRMIERLITASNWSKVNTAFAQGTGETSMVFAKDNIGNWNLKSYENDPSETLKTFTDLGSKLFDTAIDLATGIEPKDLLQKAAGIKELQDMGQDYLLGTNNSANNQDSEKAIDRVKEHLLAVASNLQTIDSALKNKEEKIIESLADKDKLTENSELDEKIKDLKNHQENLIHAQKEHAKAQQMTLVAEEVFLNFEGTVGDKNDKEQAWRVARSDESIKQVALQNAQEQLETFNQNSAQFIKEQQQLEVDIAQLKTDLEQVQKKRLVEPQKALAKIKQILSIHQKTIEIMQENVIAE